MKRRAFIKYFAATAATFGVSPASRLNAEELFPRIELRAWQESPELLADLAEYAVVDNLYKSSDFDRAYADDIYLPLEQKAILQQLVARLTRLQRLIGYANFNLIGIDEAIKYAGNFSQVGEITKIELEFIEAIFSTNAVEYGFYGSKLLTRLSDQVNLKDTVKISGTGHYIYKGDAQRAYKKIRKDLGQNITLTSGIRGIIKQMHLFLNKAVETQGNLSQASRSLAPPGHSYHAIGDFDVGKSGLGADNFTARFAETDEYKRLCDLGYVKIRYTVGNPFGVRFEPWHIKVV